MQIVVVILNNPSLATAPPYRKRRLPGVIEGSDEHESSGVKRWGVSGRENWDTREDRDWKHRSACKALYGQWRYRDWEMRTFGRKMDGYGSEARTVEAEFSSKLHLRKKEYGLNHNRSPAL